MKRPNKEWDIAISESQSTNEIKRYIDDLEQYCDELEKDNLRLKEENDEYMQSQHKLFMDLQKYKTALDKAIGMIVFEKPLMFTSNEDKLVLAVNLKESLLNE